LTQIQSYSFSIYWICFDGPTGGLELWVKTPTKNRTPVRIQSLYSPNYLLSKANIPAIALVLQVLKYASVCSLTAG